MLPRLPRFPPLLLLLREPHSHDVSVLGGLKGPPSCLGASRYTTCRCFRAASAAARRRQQQQQQHVQQSTSSAAAAVRSARPSLETPGASSLRRHFEWDMGLTAPEGPSSFRSPRAFRGPPRLGLNHPGDRGWDRETRLLVSEAIEAARLGVGSALYWGSVARRAQEVAGFLGAADVAAVLYAVSRGNGGAGEETAAACAGLVPRLEALVPHMSSLQLTQTISALARLQVPASPILLQRLRQRLGCLLAGDAFQQPFELAMLLSACSKLRLADPALLEELGACVVRVLQRVGSSPFRDLAVIAKALASSPPLRFHDVFVCIADAAMRSLNEATCLDLARLLQAFAAAAAQRASWPEQQQQQQQQKADPEGSACGELSAGRAAVAPRSDQAAFASVHRQLFNACIEAAGDRIPGASPAELSVAAQAFGLALVDSHGPDTKALACVLESIRRVSVKCLSLFLPQHVASLLLTFARWRLTFPSSDLLKVINRLSQLSCMHEETPATAPRAAAAAAADAVAPWPHHPLFFASGSAMHVSIDTTTRISCLFSLGVLLRPCAAAAAAAADALPVGCQQQQAAYSSNPAHAGSGMASEAVGAFLPSGLCSNGPAALPQGQQQQATVHAAATAAAEGAAAGAAEALEAAEGLFEAWIGSIFKDLSQGPRCRNNGGDMQPVLRLAEALVNCSFLRNTRRVVRPLQQLVLQRHRSLDPVTSSKLLHLFRLLGLPEGHDLLLLLQQQAEQLQGPVAASGTARNRAQTLTVVGLPAVLHAESKAANATQGRSPVHASSSSSAAAAHGLSHPQP